jgi:hypothetical protein
MWSIFVKFKGVTHFNVKKVGLNSCTIQAEKSGPERLGSEWLGLNVGNPFEEMNVSIINTNIYFSISEKLGRTTSSLPSGIQICDASSGRFLTGKLAHVTWWSNLPKVFC